jgi:hypothetical protein
MCAPRVTRRTSIRYLSSCHTRVNTGASIFFTAAMISVRSFGFIVINICNHGEHYETPRMFLPAINDGIFFNLNRLLFKLQNIMYCMQQYSDFYL